MKHAFLLYYTFFTFYVSSSEIKDLNILYLENLINQSIANFEVYEFPTTNQEFKAGSESENIEDLGSVDFVIVGAGTAGNVVATRLSEIFNWTILVLEAGGEENDLSDIPAYWWILQKTDLNWGYFSTPQQNACLGMRERKCSVSRGKVIGGSSVLNGMMYVRGNKQDYDKWGELVDPGWSYENVLPYFVRSENSQVDGDYGYHGKGGLWNVEFALPPSGLYKPLLNGNAELNHYYTDYNGINQIGFSKTQSNIKRGRRQSTGRAFLENARKRYNVKVITKALATKIVIEDKVAKGVIFVTGNKKYKVSALKEIIISAGAINTPQLLMLSGIGPSKHLEDLKIDLVEDLPVGEEYIDHPMFVGFAFQTNYTLPFSTLQDQISQYLNGKGPLTLAVSCDAVGFIQADSNGTAPTVEYMFLPPDGGNPKILADVLNFDTEVTDNFYANIDSNSTLNLFVILLHPKSRGKILLKSTNPVDFPDININMLSDDEEIDILIKGIEYVLKLGETNAFKEINATVVDLPFCNDFAKYSREYWECAIRYMSTTVYHPCRTAPMGKNKTTSVVDKNLKVHGISNLRVVDASVIPTSISGHTSAPTVMIAERASDLIKNEYEVSL